MTYAVLDTASYSQHGDEALLPQSLPDLSVWTHQSASDVWSEAQRITYH